MLSETKALPLEMNNNIEDFFDVKCVYGLIRMPAGIRTPENLTEEYYKQQRHEKNEIENTNSNIQEMHFHAVALKDLQHLCYHIQQSYKNDYDAFCIAKEKENQEKASNTGYLSWLTKKSNLEFFSQVTLTNLTTKNSLHFKDFAALSEYLQTNMSLSPLADTLTKENINKSSEESQSLSKNTHSFWIPPNISYLDRAKEAGIKTALVATALGLAYKALTL